MAMEPPNLLQQATERADFETNWPQILEEILAQLNTVLQTTFPPPSLPAPVARSSPSPRLPTIHGSSQESHKENAPPVAATTQPASSEPRASSTITFQSSDPPISTPTLPPPLTSLHQTICKTLLTNFSTHPPQTVQRLAELVLHPKQNYRYLPSWLRAVDRVVNVSSTTAIFPLQPTPTMPNGAGAGHIGTPTSQPQLGSDESLGGALLTPISWLSRSPGAEDDGDFQAGSTYRVGGSTLHRLYENGYTDDDDLIDSPSPPDETERDRALQSESTEIVEGPRGAGRIETVSVIQGQNGPILQRSMRDVSPDSEQQDILIGLSRADSAEAAALSDDGESVYGPPSEPIELGEPVAKADDVADSKDYEGPGAITAEDIGPVHGRVGPGQKLDFDEAAGKGRRDSNAVDESDQAGTDTARTHSRDQDADNAIMLVKADDEVMVDANGP